MKKIKIGDHEITIGPEVVTITGDTTINPTTDMEIRFNLPDDVPGISNTCTVTLGTAPVGCIVKFIFNYTITTFNRYKNIIISHNNKTEYYIRGMNAIYIYNGTRWQAIGVTETLSSNNRGLIFTGKYYEGNPVHVYTGESKKHRSENAYVVDGNYDKWTFDYSNNLPQGAKIISMTGYIQYSDSSTTDLSNSLTIGSVIYSSTNSTILYSTLGSPGDGRVYIWTQSAAQTKAVKANVMIEFTV